MFSDFQNVVVFAAVYTVNSGQSDLAKAAPNDPQSEAQSQVGFTVQGHLVHSWQTNWRTNTHRAHW